MAGDYAAVQLFPIDRFATRIASLSPSFRAKFGPQRVVTDPMEAAYMSVKLWAAAVNEAGSLDIPARSPGDARLHALPSPAGELRIDPTTQHAYKTPAIGQITDAGQFEIVWTAAQPVAPSRTRRSVPPKNGARVLHDLQRSWNGQWAAPQ